MAEVEGECGRSRTSLRFRSEEAPRSFVPAHVGGDLEATGPVGGRPEQGRTDGADGVWRMPSDRCSVGGKSSPMGRWCDGDDHGGEGHQGRNVCRGWRTTITCSQILVWLRKWRRGGYGRRAGGEDEVEQVFWANRWTEAWCPEHPILITINMGQALLISMFFQYKILISEPLVLFFYIDLFAGFEKQAKNQYKKSI